MLVPGDSIRITKSDDGFVATTSLLDGPTGAGRTEAEATRDLNRAVRNHLRMVHAAGEEIPEAFRVPTSRKVLWAGLFLLGLAVVRVLLEKLWAMFR